MIGIDPGLNGAIAWYDPTRVNPLIVWGMPLTASSSAAAGSNIKSSVDGYAVARILNHTSKDTPIIIEDVHSMPGQGVVSMFSFGLNYGRVLGIAEAQGRTIHRIRPAVWKSILGLGANKEDSIRLARKSFPDHADAYFSRKKDDGRAEASLLAKLGYERFTVLAQKS